MNGLPPGHYAFGCATCDYVVLKLPSGKLTICPNCGTPLRRTQSRRARLSLIGRVADIDIDELLSRVKPERDFDTPEGWARLTIEPAPED